MRVGIDGLLANAHPLKTGASVDFILQDIFAMNKYIRKFPLLAAVIGGITLTASAGGLDQNLVAKWTFKNGSLTSEMGGITLIEGGRRGSVETGENSVTLRDHKYLVTSEISSAKLPDLQESVTIWARLKFEKFPDSGEGAVLGLMARPSDGNWRDYVFSLIYMGLPDKPVSTETGEQPIHPGLSFIGRMSDDTHTGIGVTRYQPVSLGSLSMSPSSSTLRAAPSACG